MDHKRNYYDDFFLNQNLIGEKPQVPKVVIRKRMKDKNTMSETKKNRKRHEF
jgi:hypothetical protein